MNSLSDGFSNYYIDINKSIPKKEDAELTTKIIGNLNKIAEIKKINSVAFLAFSSNGSIDLDSGSFSFVHRPLRGFLQRNVYASISSFTSDLENLPYFITCVKKYFQQHTPKPSKIEEVQESIKGAIAGLEKLKESYHSQGENPEEKILKEAIKDLTKTQETIRKNAEILSSNDTKSRIETVLNSSILTEELRFKTLENVIRADFSKALEIQSPEVIQFFKNSIFASNEKNNILFLTSIILLNHKSSDSKNLQKIFSDIEEIEKLPLEKKAKKEIELSLIEKSGLFKPFIEERLARKAKKTSKIVPLKAAPSDYIAKATLKLLIGGGLAALAWKNPKFKGTLPYVISFALSAYSDTQKYWQATPKEEKLLIIHDIEKLTKLEHKSPGTILKMITDTIDTRTKEGEEELKAITKAVNAVRANLGLDSEPSKDNAEVVKETKNPSSQGSKSD